MLHPQITHSVLGAKAVAHNKTAILIATYSTYSLFLSTKQTSTANNVGTQWAAEIGITFMRSIMLLYYVQQGDRYRNKSKRIACLLLVYFWRFCWAGMSFVSAASCSQTLTQKSSRILWLCQLDSHWGSGELYSSFPHKHTTLSDPSIKSALISCILVLILKRE